MLRVVLVDDEYLIRQSIKNSINWESLDMEIIEEAEDGKQALEVIENAKPEIVIMDINIPFINGIKVSKVIRQRYPNIRIIILTGYDEFKYAKEAVNMGLFNYILKPIDVEEFEKVMQAAKLDILNEKKKNSYVNKIEYNNHLIEKEEFVNTLICNNNEEFYKNIEEQIKNYNLELAPNNLVVLVIGINELKEKAEDQEEVKTIIFGVKNITEQILSAVTFVSADNNIVSILNGLDVSTGRNFTMLNSDLANITDFVKSFYDYSLTISVSEYHNGFDLIPLCYKEAIEAMSKKFIYGNNRIIYFENKDNDKNTKYHIFYDRERILFDLRIYNFESVTKKIYEIFHKLQIDKSSKEFVLYISIDLMAIMFDFLGENNLQISEVLENNDELTDLLKSKEEINQIREEIIKFYSKGIDYICSNHKSTTAEVAKRAKDYIENNYADGNLCLEDLAAKIFVNPSYLCKVFKKELGTSIGEYLTKLRLKKAKEIIDSDSNVKLVDISESVGYNDQYYFSKCFKKFFGVTPIKYLQNRNSS